MARADRTSRTSAIRLLAGLLAALVVTPVPGMDAAPPDPAGRIPDVAGPTLLPSIHFEDAAAHENDRIDFPVGDRVRVGFRPREGDSWTVAGGRSRALPAGRADGRSMRADPSIDGPGGATAPDAASASWSEFAAGSFTDPLSAPIESDGSGLRREVFGFLPYWELSDTSTTLDYDLLSTIAYFSVGVDRAGNLRKRDSDGSLTTGWAGWTSSKMTSVIEAAHARGTRVVLTVTAFAWTTSGADTQASLLGSATARGNLAKQVAAAVRDRGADGVNLDFEPIVSGYADEFTSLVRLVRAELDAQAPGYQLTFDTTGWIGNYPLADATAPGGADAIFIMGYDYRTSSASVAGSISPLGGPVYDLADTIEAYTARVDPSKLILGVPYYGRAWSTPTDGPHAQNISGTKYGASSTALYSTALELAAANGRRWDPIEQVPWTAYQKQVCTTTYGCVTTWRELYYDDAESLRAKYDLVNRTGLRGAGIWALGYDDARPELYQALADRFLGDRTPPVVGIELLAERQRDEGFLVRWSAFDESTVTEFDVQVSIDGGAWAAWLTATDETGAIYPGRHGRGYAFRVRARDSHGNASDWSDGAAATAPAVPPALAPSTFATVLANGLRMRREPTTSGVIERELTAGDVLWVLDGPVAAEGYSWFQVDGPIRQWGPVEDVETGLWVAVAGNGQVYAVGRTPAHATVVDAGIRDLRVVGADRLLSPNGDGLDDSIGVSWTNGRSFDTMTARVLRLDGSLVGTLQVEATAAGAATWAWDGRVGGAVVPDGSYIVALSGVAGGVTSSAPSAGALAPEHVAALAITVDHLPVTRTSGTNRYETSASISAMTFGPGVPVAYVATGTNFPDALSGAAAAGYTGGPLLLTDPNVLPAAIAAELKRLKPARIVVLGGTSVVSSAVATALRAAAVAPS